MSGPPSGTEDLSPLALLVAECVRRLEERGPSAVDELCAEHPELAPELRRRLAALEETGLVGGGRVGPYVLLRPIGRGGMGVVHLARDSRDSRLVALKALPGRLLQSEAMRQRFRREAHAVQALRHPGIVPLFEAGETDGVPWFTMEWIDGRTLADVIAALSALELAADRLDSSHLVAAAGGGAGDGAGGGSDNGAAGAAGADGRPGRGGAWVETVCRLVLDVAEALQYAHEHGVIHRDVKPGNILVGRDGKARLFDFGLARVDDATRVTLSGDFAGTPAYAAPEQLRGGQGDGLDGRADVYALGVTMYELLTLALPPDAASDNAPVAPRRLNATVGRAIETICLTALERDRDRRYASAAAFAADLRAVLERRPIAARGPRWPRRAARWAARNRGAASALGLLLVLLVGAPIGLAVANARIREQADRALEQQRIADDARRAADRLREKAEAEAKRARLRLDFLGEMLAAPSPLLDGPDVRVRDVLDRAAVSAHHDLAADPIALADTLATLGLSYYRLADFPPSEALLEQSVALCRAQPDDRLDGTLATALNGLTALRTDTQRFDAARASGEEALAINRRLHGDCNHLVAENIASLAIVAIRSGDKATAIARFAEALALQEEVLGPQDAQTIGTRLHYATVIDAPEESEALFKAGIEGLRPHVAAGREGQRLAAALRNYAILLVQQGRTEEAITTQREALDVSLRSCGEEHPDVATSRMLLAMLLQMNDEPADAMALLAEAVPAMRRASPSLDERLLSALLQLGTLQAGFNRFDEAEPVIREALDLGRRLEGPLGEHTVQAVSVLSAIFAADNRPAEAIALLEELLATAKAAGPDGASVAALCEGALAKLK